MGQNRWKRRPAGSNWGEYGEDDMLGRMNLLTPEKVKAAVAEVHEGLNFCLSLPLNYPGKNILNPRRHPPVLRPTLHNNNKPFMNYRLQQDSPNATDVINDDAVILHLQYSTQWDSLAHVGQMFDVQGNGVEEAVFYNGFKAGTDIIGPADAVDAGAIGTVSAENTTQVLALGIENMAQKGVQGRGTMVNLAKHFGKDRCLVGYAELMHVLDKDRIEILEGDLVCFNTEFATVVLGMELNPSKDILDNACPVLDGTDPKLLNWVTDSGAVALISDNYAVEAYPPIQRNGRSAVLPLHEHCLFKLGVNLGELWFLSELAEWLRANDRNHFLLTAPPLRLPGAVGSPVTPVATV